LASRDLVLASASPRRRELLAELGRPFRVLTPDVDETTPPGATPAQAAQDVAIRKARSVAVREGKSLILAADTVVSLDGVIIGKPRDRADAVAILSRLSGSRHAVITGVCLLDAASGRCLADSVTTWVTMRRMSRREIAAYVDSGEADGKAGAYAIQETADRYVERVEGSFSNVVGLPMERLREMLAEMEGGTPS
jgi:septum formation protein